MKRPEPEPVYSPTSIYKEYGSAKLRLSLPSVYSLDIFAIQFAH